MISVMKASQVGASEAARNVIGYKASVESEPIGIALPSRDKGRMIVDNRIIPMFRSTPCLSDLFTGKSHDLSKSQIKLINGVIIHLMWSGSATSLASDPMCTALNDEVDKFEAWAGREADPVSLVRARLRAYEERALLINMSTPTLRMGKIAQLYETSAVRLHYAMACPFCRKLQRPTWNRVKWPAAEKGESTIGHAERVLSEGMAWYECEYCGEHCGDELKAGMARGGAWRDDEGMCVDTSAHTQWPRGTTVGMHMPAFPCIWVSWSQMAAEFIRADGNPDALFVWRTNTMGEPWEEQIERPKAAAFAEMAKGDPEGIVPAWASRVIASIDTQHDHFYAVVRAWGGGLNSQRVWHGRLESFEDIDLLILQGRWPIAGMPGRQVGPDVILIDSGGTKLPGEEVSRTMQVYEYVASRMSRFRIRAVKGAVRAKSAGVHIWETQALARLPKDVGMALKLWMLDTQHWQDVLQYMIAGGRWRLNNRADPEYAEHMSNMHKISIRSRAGLEERWVPIASGARIDLRDCEVYNVAGAYMLNCQTLADVSIEDSAKYNVVEPVVPLGQPAPAAKTERTRRADPWTPTPLNL